MNRIGSNQYVKTPKHNAMKYLYYYLFIVATLILVSFITKSYPRPQKVQAQIRAVPTATPTPTLSPEQAGIEDYIKQVFGKYYGKAKAVLDCENHARNPLAVNDNTKWGGVGRDWGIFQINDTWQGVSNKAFLTDPYINVRMAYNIFVRSGYSFKMWTCGRQNGY